MFVLFYFVLSMHQITTPFKTILCDSRHQLSCASCLNRGQYTTMGMDPEGQGESPQLFRDCATQTSG